MRRSEHVGLEREYVVTEDPESEMTPSDLAVAMYVLPHFIDALIACGAF
jgi:hypothetical protein